MINYKVIIIILIIIILYLLIKKYNFIEQENFSSCYCPSTNFDIKLLCDGQYFDNECHARCIKKNLDDCAYYNDKLDMYIQPKKKFS